MPVGKPNGSSVLLDLIGQPCRPSGGGQNTMARSQFPEALALFPALANEQD